MHNHLLKGQAGLIEQIEMVVVPPRGSAHTLLGKKNASSSEALGRLNVQSHLWQPPAATGLGTHARETPAGLLGFTGPDPQPLLIRGTSMHVLRNCCR